MSNDQNKSTPLQYEIQISGRIDQERASWLGDLELSYRTNPDGKTISVLSGPVPDQAALYGIINRIRDMGLKLISIHSLEYQRKNGFAAIQIKETK